MDYTPGGDVIDVLLGQHEQVKALLAKVAVATGADQQALLDDLARLLHLHESGEQQVVHPALRGSGEADEVARARVVEEKQAGEALAELKSLGVAHPQFAAKFDALRRAVLDHDTREENEEFPRLRAEITVEQLWMMAGELRTVQAMH